MKLTRWVVGVLVVLAFFGLAFLSSGCGTVRESERTVVRDTTVALQPQTVEENLPVHGDTVVIQGERVVNHDTVAVVRYFPQEKRIYVKVKPDSVRVTFHDTTYQQKTVVVEQKTPFTQVLGWVFIGVIGTGAGIILFKLQGKWF